MGNDKFKTFKMCRDEGITVVSNPSAPATSHCDGITCKKCQKTLRYIKGNSCVFCAASRDKQYAKKYPEKLKNIQLKNKYNITLEQYNKMADEQDRKCYICKKDTFLVVDHNHLTNKIRKLLCNRCNRVLGFIKEDKNLLSSMITYIEEFNGN